MNSGVHFKNPSDRSYRAAAVPPNPHRYDSPVRPVWQTHTAPSIPQLVGAVFDAASSELRVKMLEHLLRPLGVLSLAAVANGVFAKIRFRSGWPDMKIRADDVVGVKMADVIGLVDHVLQVDERVVFGLTTLLHAWPGLREFDAAAQLLQLLRERSGRDSYDDTKGLNPVWH